MYYTVQNKKLKNVFLTNCAEITDASAAYPEKTDGRSTAELADNSGIFSTCHLLKRLQRIFLNSADMSV
jgi:hypothetical protein